MALEEAGLRGVSVDISRLVSLRTAAQRLQLAHFVARTGQQSGAYRSNRRGRGMEYAESRIYMPGDDIRNMDWRVTARSGNAHSKVFQEEKEKPVILMSDFSASMFFGTRRVFKSVLAAELSAVLAWNRLQRGDRIGAFLFSGQGHHEIRPKPGHRNVLLLLRQLANFTEQPGVSFEKSGSLVPALKRVRRVGKPGSTLFIMSDFYHCDREVERHLSRLALHNRVILCHLSDPLESSPPPPGHYDISSGKQRALLDSGNKQVRQHYADVFQQRVDELRRLSRHYGMALLFFSTADSVFESLRRQGRGAGLQF